MIKQYTIPTDLTDRQIQALVEEGDRNFEEQMRRVSRAIAQDASLHFVGLTGPTCSGKTTSARLFTDYMEAHGRRVHVISLDDFYYEKDYLIRRADADPDIEIDYDSEDTIDIELLAEKTASLLAGKTTALPRFDFPSGLRVPGEVITPMPNDIFLFEGIQILYPRVHDILDDVSFCSIYIRPESSIEIGGERFLPNEIRLMRRLVRDFRYRNSTPAFTLYLWQSVRANEEKSIFPYADTCRHHINSTMPFEIGMLKPYLEEILPTVPADDPFSQKACEILHKLRAVQPISSDLIKENSLYKEFI